MTVRTFDGVDDRIQVDIGALSHIWGNWTVAVLAKSSLDAASAFQYSLSMGIATTSASLSLRKMSNTNAGRFSVVPGTDAQTAPTIAQQVADGWTICVTTHATGFVVPRFHRYRFSDANVVHEQSATAIGNTTAPITSAKLGCSPTSSAFWNGLIALAAAWPVNMTDIQVNELWANLRTSDWLNHSLGAPQALWQLNQDDPATAVVDLTGNGADQIAIVGTSATTGDDPPGWGFSPLPYTVSVSDDELIAAGGLEGSNLLKVFVKDAAGNWSV